MNRFTSAALLASLALSAGAAMAQSTQDKTAVTPGKEQVKTQQPDASTKAMDDNTQRQHSKDQATPRSDAGAAKTQTAAAGAGGVRDWAAIDKNNDKLIQPEEMEAALKEAGPQTGSKK